MADQQNHIPGKITYLVSVDESDDCRVAMRLAALRARNTGGHVVLLYVFEPAGIQHWAAVSEVMADERRQEAEERLQVLAAEVHNYADIRPVLFVEEGPFAAGSARLDPGFLLRLLRDRSLRLANLGYLGHMWELYAMWTWIPVFLHELLIDRGNSATAASLRRSRFFCTLAQ